MDTLSMDTDLETIASLFGQEKPLVVSPSNLQPPLCIEAREPPLQIVAFQ